MSSALKKTSIAIALACAAVISYLPALRGGFIWDDDLYVVDNLQLRTLHGLQNLWLTPGATPQYYPLTFTTFWIEWHLWGSDPLGYKIVNILLHMLSALLIFRLLCRLDFASAPAALAASIFLLHPVCVESVAWITERKNTLSLSLALLSMLAYFQFDGRRRKWIWWLVSFALFVAAILSKTVTASLPAVLLVLMTWKRGRPRWRDVAPLLPMVAIAIVAAMVTSHLERDLVGAVGPHWVYGSTPLLDKLARCVIASRAIWFYLAKIFWPTNLAFIYLRWHIDAREIWQYGFVVALLGLQLSAWKLRRAIGAGLLVALLIFIGVLFPALSFVNVYPHRYSFVADHFQYHASIAIIAAIAFGLTRVADKLGSRRVLSAKLAPLAAAALLLVFCGLTWSQSQIYRSAEAIWIDTLNQSNGGIAIAAHNYGVILRKRGDRLNADAMIQRALALEPDSVESLLLVGISLMEEGHPDQAATIYRRAIAQEKPDGPNPILFSEAHLGLAESLVRLKDDDGAQLEFREAVSRNPDSEFAHCDFAQLLLRRGDKIDAIEQFRQTLRINPNNEIAKQKLAELSR